MSEPRRLTPAERRAWRALLFANLLVDRDIDHQLRRDAHLSADYYGMLSRLSEAPGHSLRMSELAQLTASSPSRLTHAVTNLERVGWVRREGCPEDRRVQHAVLTDAGLAVVEAAGEAHAAEIRRCVFDALEPAEVEVLERIMTRIVEHLDPELATAVGIGPSAALDAA